MWPCRTGERSFPALSFPCPSSYAQTGSGIMPYPVRSGQAAFRQVGFFLPGDTTSPAPIWPAYETKSRIRRDRGPSRRRLASRAEGKSTAPQHFEQVYGWGRVMVISRGTESLFDPLLEGTGFELPVRGCDDRAARSLSSARSPCGWHRPRAAPPFRNRKFARLSAGGGSPERTGL